MFLRPQGRSALQYGVSDAHLLGSECRQGATVEDCALAKRFAEDFSGCLTIRSRAEALEPGGSFTLGGLNTSLYTGDIDYQSLSQSNLYWTITLSSVTIGIETLNISSSSAAAVIDTGTTLIGGPSSEVADIYAQISGSQALSGSYDGYYSYRTLHLLLRRSPVFNLSLLESL